MTQEEKELLIKDLCGRLLYGVKTSYSGYEMTIRGVDVKSKTVDVIDWGKARFAAVRIEKIKPYLRSLSSMTKSERKEFDDLSKFDEDVWMGNHKVGFPKQARIMSKCVDWLDRKMFDHRGLIPKGLALEAKEGMYNN